MIFQSGLMARAMVAMLLGLSLAACQSLSTTGMSAASDDPNVAITLPTLLPYGPDNPPPTYPVISKMAREQGRVLVRVLIGADGITKQAEVHQSSGFKRLDQRALTTALSWRYVPGKRGGVPEAMWFNVPINFVLE